jgi:hypothetical protein
MTQKAPGVAGGFFLYEEGRPWWTAPVDGVETCHSIGDIQWTWHPPQALHFMLGIEIMSL